jgi:Putative porin
LDERDAQKFPWLSVVGGRFLSPWATPTDLIFHKDLTFDGVAATGRFGLGDGSAEQSHLFLTLGAHPLQEIALSPQDKWLVGAQFGANLRFAENQQLHLSAAFFDYFNVTGRLNPSDGTIYNYTAPTFLRQGNTYFDISNSTDPTVNLFALAAKFRLVNLNATYTLPVNRYTFGVALDAVKNVAYDATRVSDNFGQYVPPRTKGYQAELSFGDPAVLTPGAWRAVIGYRYLQRDAVIDAYTDSDFHWGGTDAVGYYLVGDVGVARRVWVRVRYLSSNAIDGPAPGGLPAIQLGIDTLQVDLNTRF